MKFISTNDELQVIIEFPERPINRPYFTEWRITKRTPDDAAWQSERRLIKDLADRESTVMNFSSPGLYEFEVSAVDKEESIVSIPMSGSFCKSHPEPEMLGKCHSQHPYDASSSQHCILAVKSFVLYMYANSSVFGNATFLIKSNFYHLFRAKAAAFRFSIFDL